MSLDILWRRDALRRRRPRRVAADAEASGRSTLHTAATLALSPKNPTVARAGPAPPPPA